MTADGLASNLSSSKKNLLIGFIRNELRITLDEERHHNRELSLMKKRSAFGESMKNRCFWNRKEIINKARELKKAALSTKDYLTLQNSLIKSEENVNSFLEENETLDALTRDLTCANPAIQLIAASCCCNIALANSKICNLLAKAVGPYLIAELGGLNYPILEVCVWTIGNLSAGSQYAFEILYAQGCIGSLTSLINDCNESILSSIFYAITRCLYSGHDIITDSEVKDLTLALIRRDNFFHDPETMWIIALLSSREASHEQLIFMTDRIFRLVWTTMNNSDQLSIELMISGIRFLGNIVCEPMGMAADIFLNSSKSSDIASFFEKLFSCSHLYVRKETLWFLGNLYTHVQPTISARIRSDLIPLLTSLNCFLS